MAPVGPSLSQQDERRRSEKRFDVGQRFVQLGRRIKHAVVGNYPQELVDAGLRLRPGLVVIGLPSEHPMRASAVREFLAVRVDEQVGVQRDQSLPSIRSKRASRSSSRTPGRSRPRSGRQRRR